MDGYSATQPPGLLR